MADDRKYVRVYHDDLLRDYPDVYSDDAQLAAWLRLLAVADALWPTPPELPRSIKARPLDALVRVGLIIRVGSHRYRVKGQDAERTKRQDAARNAAASRWHSERNAIGNAEAMPKRAEPSKAEPNQAEQTAAHDPWNDPEQQALVWLSKHGCDIRPGNGYHQKLVTAVERHGINAVVGMLDRLASAGTKHGDTKGFLFGAIDALDSRNRPKLSDIEKEDRAEDTERTWKAKVARTKQLAHENGYHVEPDPGCPSCVRVTA